MRGLVLRSFAIHRGHPILGVLAYFLIKERLHMCVCLSLMYGHGYEARKLKLCTKVYFYTRMDMRYVALTKQKNIPGRNIQNNTTTHQPYCWRRMQPCRSNLMLLRPPLFPSDWSYQFKKLQFSIHNIFIASINKS